MIHEFDLGSSDRGFSPQVWLGFNDGVDARNPRVGYMDKFTDFDQHFVASSADYTLTQATQGTFAHDATVGNIGVWLLDCNSSTAAQGANLQFDKWIVQLTGSTVCAFEVRLKAADIATGPEFFAGLSATDTSIIGSSAITTGDKIGFWSTTDDNVLLFGAGDSAVPTASTTSPHTFVDDAYVKLGFRVEYDSKVSVFVNGSKVANSVALSTVPDGLLVPSFVCQSGGTTDPIVHLDWMRLAIK